MKASVVLAILAAGAASAQRRSSSSSSSLSSRLSSLSSASSSATYNPPTGTGGASIEPTLTGLDPTLTALPIVTGTTTAFYCPTCVHYTTYVTEYDIFCPTGVIPHTYTITETCTGSLPTPHPPGECPPGFTTGVQTCNICGPTPITKTLTYPPAHPTPYIPPGKNTPLPCPGPGCPGLPPGQKPPVPYVPCPGGPNCPPAAPPSYPPAAPPSSPPASPPAQQCPGGPGCPVMPAGNMTFTPYKGAASSNVAQLSGIFASFIGIGVVAAML